MKKMSFLTIVVFVVLSPFCVSAKDFPWPLLIPAITNGAQGNTIPVLHEVEVSGMRFLADENGTLIYSMEAPHVYMDVDRGVVVIKPTVYYAPGTTYYDSKYSGFIVDCGGHPRAGVEVININFGPDAGEFEIPRLPYEGCTFQAFVIDGAGTTFNTDTYNLFFSRE